MAAVSGANPAYLWQLLNGTRLPSGEPRGIGNALCERLEAAFPGSFNSGIFVSRTPVHATEDAELKQALSILGARLAQLSPQLREAVATNLSGWARDAGAEHWAAIVASLCARNDRRSA